MEIKITTLAENSATQSCIAEWGLSMLVEADGKTILFDTGLGTAALSNAITLGIDFTKIDVIVLSHGHFDHTGGLLETLKRGGPKPILAHPDIWTAKYGSLDNTPARFIGIPHRPEVYEALGGEFHLSTQPQNITDRIMTTGQVPMQTSYETVESYLRVRKDGELKQDELLDDQSMVIDTDYGLVVVLGCAHRGLINTLTHACDIAGKDHIYAAIGGTHLLHASEERLQKNGRRFVGNGGRVPGGFPLHRFWRRCFSGQYFRRTFFSEQCRHAINVAVQLMPVRRLARYSRQRPVHRPPG